MNGRIRPSLPLVARLGLVVAMLVCVAALSRPAHAQEERTILWLPTVTSGAPVSADQLEQIFYEILGADRTNRHIIGRRGLATLVERGGFSLPRCVQGHEPCQDVAHAVAQSIGADLVARVHLELDGATLSLELLDGEFVPFEQRSFAQTDLRRAVYAAIAETTDATAWLIVQAEPVEGRVSLDGRDLGPTPWQGSLAIGTYSVEVRADGYYDWNQTIELRAGDNRTAHAALARRFGDLRVRSGLPGAQVFLDGDDTPYPVNESFPLPPGQYVVELRAPGFDPQFRHVTLSAGDEVDFRLDLRESLATIHQREEQLLRARPLLLEATLAWNTSGSSFEDLRGSAHGGRRTVDCIGGIDGCSDGTTRVGHFGLDLGVAWQRGFLEIPVLGLGIRHLGNDAPSTVYRLGGADDYVTFDGGREILLRLPGGGVRWLINHRFEPWARAGFALAFESWDGRETGPSQGDVRFSRTNFLLEFRGGLRFHFNRLLFATADFQIAPSLNQHPATRFGLSAGVGVNLPFAWGAPSHDPEESP